MWRTLRRAFGFLFHTWHRLEGRELFQLKIKMDQAGADCAPASKMCSGEKASKLMDVFCELRWDFPECVMLSQNEYKGSIGTLAKTLPSN